jgi:hypothetical protein
VATTLATIAKYLDNRNWLYEIDEAKSRIVSGVKSENVEQFIIVIQLLRDGELIQIYVPKLVHVRDRVFKGLLFQSLLHFLWEVCLVRFEYDPTDGEIRASIDLILEDADLSERQFNCALSLLVDAIDTHAMPRIKTILATGTDPGRKQLAEKMLQQMPEDLVDLLGQAIRDRQQSNRSS